MHLGGAIIGTAQTANFAAVFAEDLHHAKDSMKRGAADMPQVDVDGAEVSTEPATQNQSETNATPQKEARGLTDPELSGDQTALTGTAPKVSDATTSKPLANQVDPTKSASAHGTEGPLMSENTSDMPGLAAKTVTDPWQTAVLPDGAAPFDPAGQAKSLSDDSTPTQPQTEGFAAKSNTKFPTAGPMPPNASDAPAPQTQQPASLTPPEKHLIAEFANPAPKPQIKLTARFAEPAGPQTPHLAPISAQTGIIAPIIPQTAVAKAARVGAPDTAAMPHDIKTKESSPSSVTTVPKPNGQAAVLLPASTPLVTPPISQETLPVTNPRGQLILPDVDQTNATTPTRKSTEIDAHALGLQKVQANTRPDLPPSKSVISPTTLETTKAATPEHDWRKPARFDPTGQNLPPTSIETTKLAAPLVPWQAVTSTLRENTSITEPLAIEPFSGEPRLSTLSSTPTAHSPIQRSDLPPQIARQLAEAIQQSPNRPVEITLKPQELGAVRLSVQQAEAGIIVSLTAERPETLDLMRRHIDQLGQDFQAMGYANIAFSFAGSDAEPDTQPGSTPSNDTAEAEDTTAAPATHIHLSNGTTGGVDLRL